MRAHNQLGPGYPEEVYERALFCELDQQNIPSRWQVISYLKATGAPVGLLLNFGRKKLEFKRIFPPKKLDTEEQRAGRQYVQKSILPDPNP